LLYGFLCGRPATKPFPCPTATYAHYVNLATFQPLISSGNRLRKRAGLGPVATPRKAILPPIIRPAAGTASENLSLPGRTHTGQPTTRTFPSRDHEPVQQPQEGPPGVSAHRAGPVTLPSHLDGCIGRPGACNGHRRCPGPGSKGQGDQPPGWCAGPITGRGRSSPCTSPARPSFLAPVGLLHRHQADPVTVPGQPSWVRCRGASLRAWAVVRYSGPVDHPGRAEEAAGGRGGMTWVAGDEA
jgi:hypothetical protein